ncbi:MAG: hypothetical protein AB7N76_04615 [Planctomycetota bacterium]
MSGPAGDLPSATTPPTTPAREPREALRAPRPSWARLSAVLLGTLAWALALGAAARALSPTTGWGLAASLVLGALAMLVVGSVCEWLVHRYLMHHPRPLRVAYELHHRGHHWTHFRPDAYLQPEVSYIPVLPPRPARLCATRGQRLLAVLGQAGFYSCFGAPLLLAAWLGTGNLAFVLAGLATALAIVFLCVHVHDAVHCPGHSPLERFGWFWFLDRHHYVHHVDTLANTNFLLPLGDLLLGTLRRELTPAELRRWPSYEQARAQGAAAPAQEPALVR